MISPKNVICVSLTIEAIDEICKIADEQSSTLAAVGRTLIQESLRARGRAVPDHVSHRIARKRRLEASQLEGMQAA